MKKKQDVSGRFTATLVILLALLGVASGLAIHFYSYAKKLERIAYAPQTDIAPDSTPKKHVGGSWTFLKLGVDWAANKAPL